MKFLITVTSRLLCFLDYMKEVVKRTIEATNVASSKEITPNPRSRGSKFTVEAPTEMPSSPREDGRRHSRLIRWRCCIAPLTFQLRGSTPSASAIGE